MRGEWGGRVCGPWCRLPARGGEHARVRWGDRGRGIGKGSAPRRLGVGPPGRGPRPSIGRARSCRARSRRGEKGVVAARRAPGAGWQVAVSSPAGVRQVRLGGGHGEAPGLSAPRASRRAGPCIHPSFAPAAPGSARAEAGSARVWSRLGDACPGGGPRDAAASSVRRPSTLGGCSRRSAGPEETPALAVGVARVSRCPLLCLSLPAFLPSSLPPSETRPQIRRGDPLNLSILVSGGKETNQDSLSNGE